METKKKLELDLKDIYQLLISECRYGYRRNNHLMPDGAYDKVKRLVPQMYEIDKEYAVYTVKQICEECISEQLIWNFHDGEDDEHGNRQDAIDFVNWCLDWIHKNEASSWQPYNYNGFTANLKKDAEPRYLVYELRGKSKRKKLITPTPVSKNEYHDLLFKDIPAGVTGTYRKEEHLVSNKLNDRRRHYVYHILSPFKKDYYIKHI